IIPYTDRLDYLAGMNNNLAYVLAVEKLIDVKIPLRAQLLRMICAELMRIASHLFGVGIYIMDLGAVTGVFYSVQQREYILDALAELSGGRMTFNYMRIGGVAADANEAFYPAVEKFIANFAPFLKEYHKLIDKNEIFLARTKDIGIISPEMAKNYGLTGPNLRASGVNYDIRKIAPYCLYDEIPFNVPLGEKGDCFDRYMVRVLEMEESYKIVQILLKMLKETPPGEIMAKVPKILKPAAGEIYYQTENPKGAMGCHIVSDGGTTPYRLHFRRPSFMNVAILDQLFIGYKMADLVAIVASLDFVLGEVDA
ncbi:MAG: NADH-quinone oxidoreductase subunit D, partial [Clostridiales bacterium]